jgi:DNA-binding XRE family transcriptional regulator
MIKHEKTTSNALKILDRITGNDRDLQRLIEEERDNLEVARKIYGLREKAGLTQKELAERVGTTQSVISQLEDADYSGHSLTMLKRIAAALNQRVEVRFVAAGPKSPSDA